MEPAHVPDRLLLKIMLTAAVAVSALWVAVAGARHAPAYYSVHTLSAAGVHTHEGEYLRVKGFVIGGTIRHLENGRHYFLLASNGVTLPVFLQAELPASVRDQSEVVVSGTFVQRYGTWMVEGDEIFAKCAIRYGRAPRDADVKFQ